MKGGQKLMVISDDISYVKQSFVDRGFAKATPYMIRLDRYFTEEQKENNRTFAEKVGFCSKEWQERCEFMRQRVAEDNLSTLKTISMWYNLGQFIPNDRRRFTFWFCCNDLAFTARDGRSGRDYSYCTLTLSDSLCYFGSKTKEEIFSHCKRILGDLRTVSNQAIFQYSTEYDPDAVCNAAHVIYEEIKGQWIKQNHMVGKVSILKGKGEYAFMLKKKYAKGDNGQFAFSDINLVDWGIENGII